MAEDPEGRQRQEDGVSSSLKLFILPPLLSLAVVAPALMGFMSYQTWRSTETTYVVTGMQQNRACSLCHSARQIRPAAFR
jgi:hypothetical protein